MTIKEKLADTGQYGWDTVSENGLSLWAVDNGLVDDLLAHIKSFNIY